MDRITAEHAADDEDDTDDEEHLCRLSNFNCYAPASPVDGHLIPHDRYRVILFETQAFGITRV